MSHGVNINLENISLLSPCCRAGCKNNSLLTFLSPYNRASNPINRDRFTRESDQKVLKMYMSGWEWGAIRI